MELDASSPSDLIWYFAYGSNMSRAKFTGSRGIIPLAVARVLLPGWTLTTEIPGLPYSEPAMSSIARICDRDSQSAYDTDYGLGNRLIVHGVAYLVSRQQYTAIIASEGGGIAYDDVAMRAVAVGDCDEKIIGRRELIVRTLVNVPSMRRRDPTPLPSARYMGLLTVGAKEAKLPQEYRKYLESWPVYRFPQAPGASNCPCDRPRPLFDRRRRHHYRYISIRPETYNDSDDPEKGRLEDAVDWRLDTSSEDEQNKRLMINDEKDTERALTRAHHTTDEVVGKMRAWLGALIFLAIFTPALAGMERLCNGTLRPSDGQCPDWVKRVVRWVVWAIWWCHDVGFAPLFGPGDGSRRENIPNSRGGRAKTGTEQPVSIAFSPWWGSR